MTRLYTVSALAALLTGCVANEPEVASTAGPSYEAWKAQLKREPGTGMYIVDWDVAIRDEARLYQQWQLEQAGQALSIFTLGGSDVKWSDTQKLNLTYCIGAGFANKAAVVTAMKIASDDNWEKFGNVNFIYVPAQDANCNAANANVMFDVNAVNSNNTYLARSFFPNDARADRNVLIDPKAFTSAVTIENILIHELGHTLGFRHEHIARPGQAAQGCVEDQNYRVLQGYDQVSTMHYPQCGSPGNTLALSAKDKTGIALVYGESVAANVSPTASITLPTNGQQVANTFNVEAMVVDTNLKTVELFIDSATTASQSLTEVSANGVAMFNNVDIAQDGDHTLIVKATDTLGMSTQKTVSIHVGVGATDANGNPATSSGDVSGGCNTGGDSTGWAVALGLLGLALRRQARERTAGTARSPS